MGLRDVKDIEAERVAGLAAVGGVLDKAKASVVITLDHAGDAHVCIFPGGAGLHQLLGLIELAKIKLVFGNQEAEDG